MRTQQRVPHTPHAIDWEAQNRLPAKGQSGRCAVSAWECWGCAICLGQTTTDYTLLPQSTYPYPLEFDKQYDRWVGMSE